MPPLPQPARPGDLITAAVWNALLAKVAELEDRLEALEQVPPPTRPTLTFPTLTFTQPTLTIPTRIDPTLTFTQPTLTIPTRIDPTLTFTQPTLTIPTRIDPTLTFTQPTLTIPTRIDPTLPGGPIFTLPGPIFPGGGPVTQPIGVLIPGIGRNEAQLLRDAGIDRIEALAAATPDQLSGVLNVGVDEASAIIRNARSLLG